MSLGTVLCSGVGADDNLTTITTGETERLSGVSSCGPRNTWAVGAKGVILHWDGARWSKSKNPSDKNLTILERRRSMTS